MYTLEKVLELVNVGEDIYCELYRPDRSIICGRLSDMELKPDTRIEMYGVETDADGVEYLVLYLA